MDAVPTWIKSTGSHFYKYRGSEKLERIKTLILQHKLYVPLVGELNDPADGRPKLAEMSYEQMFTFLFNTARNPTLSHDAQRDEISKLNDHIQRVGIEELNKRAVRMLYEHCERYRIYSLSKRWNILSQWAKYASEHMGCCLEFANSGTFFGRAVDVQYGRAFQMDVNNPEHRKAFLFFCKRQDWSNEEEVRVIIPPGHDGTVGIDPGCLTRLILGMSIDHAKEKHLREWAQHRKPPLAVVKAYFDPVQQELCLKP